MSYDSDRRAEPDFLTATVDKAGRTVMDAIRELDQARRDYERRLQVGRADYSLLDERADR